MRKLDITALRKEQAKLLRSKGMSIGKTADWTGLTKGVVNNISRGIGAVEEDKTIEERMKAGKACLYCGADLPEHNGVGRYAHYCGNTCRREYWRIHRDEVAQKPKSIYTHTCAYCGKTFESYGKRARKYCDRHCFMLHRNGHKLPNLEAI